MKTKRITERDYVKASRRGSREAEIENHNRPICFQSDTQIEKGLRPANVGRQMIKASAFVVLPGRTNLDKRTVSILKIFSVKGNIPDSLRSALYSHKSGSIESQNITVFHRKDLGALSVILSDQKVNRFLPNYFY